MEVELRGGTLVTGHVRDGERPAAVDLSVIAPCFNEEANVPLLVARLLAVFERRGIADEIVLVNDCSTDGTGRVIDGLAGEHPEVVAVHHPRKLVFW